MPKRRSSNLPSKTRRTKALVTGSVALGAYLTGAVVRWARRSTLYRPEDLPPALKAAVHEQELMEGRARFYTNQMFSDRIEAPHGLVNYAFLTTNVRGAHHAPRRFLDGTLFIPEHVRHAYARLRRPTLIVTPEQNDGLIQSFETLSDVAASNDAYIQIHTLPTGLLPHWETPEAFFDLLDDFLA